MEREKFDKAFHDLSASIATRPDDPRAFEYRARCRQEMGDDNGALDDLTTALRHAPNSARLYRARGLLRAELRVDGGALKDLRRAVELQPAWEEKLGPIIDALHEKPE